MKIEDVVVVQPWHHPFSSTHSSFLIKDKMRFQTRGRHFLMLIDPRKSGDTSETLLAWILSIQHLRHYSFRLVNTELCDGKKELRYEIYIGLNRRAHAKFFYDYFGPPFKIDIIHNPYAAWQAVKRRDGNNEAPRFSTFKPGNRGMRTDVL